jgi:hypothetical protein
MTATATRPPCDETCTTGCGSCKPRRPAPAPRRLTARGRFVREVAAALAVSSFFALAVVAFSVLEVRA